MTHIEFLQTSNLVEVHAIKGNSVYYTDLCDNRGYAEINGGGDFPCHSLEEFEELVEFFGDETFEE